MHHVIVLTLTIIFKYYSLWEMLDVIPYHRRYLLKIHLVTSSLYVLYFIQETLDVLFLKIADELPKEDLQILVSHTVLTLVE